MTDSSTNDGDAHVEGEGGYFVDDGKIWVAGDGSAEFLPTDEDAEFERMLAESVESEKHQDWLYDQTYIPVSRSDLLRG